MIQHSRFSLRTKFKDISSLGGITVGRPLIRMNLDSKIIKKACAFQMNNYYNNRQGQNKIKYFKILNIKYIEKMICILYLGETYTEVPALCGEYQGPDGNDPKGTWVPVTISEYDDFELINTNIIQAGINGCDSKSAMFWMGLDDRYNTCDYGRKIFHDYWGNQVSFYGLGVFWELL